MPFAAPCIIDPRGKHYRLSEAPRPASRHASMTSCPHANMPGGRHGKSEHAVQDSLSMTGVPVNHCRAWRMPNHEPTPRGARSFHVNRSG